MNVAAWLKENPAAAKNVKPCPGCKRLTEKNGGCSNHNCVLCGFNFCWMCLGAYGRCKCARLAEKKRTRKQKKRERRDRKRAEKLEARILSIVNSNNFASTWIVERETVERSMATMETVEDVVVLQPPPVVVVRAPRRPNAAAATASYQDWDVVVLNPRARVVAQPVAAVAPVLGKGKEEMDAPVVAPVMVPAPMVAGEASAADAAGADAATTTTTSTKKKKKKVKSSKGWLPVPVRLTAKAQ